MVLRQETDYHLELRQAKEKQEPPDIQAAGPSWISYPELQPGQWNRHRYIRWFGIHDDGMRTDQPNLLHDGAG